MPRFALEVSKGYGEDSSFQPSFEVGEPWALCWQSLLNALKCTHSVTISTRRSPMAPWSREAVLCLYRALLRQGRELRYTDRDFYFASIRREFRKNQKLENLEAREKQLEKGLVFLHSKLGGLI